MVVVMARRECATMKGFCTYVALAGTPQDGSQLRLKGAGHLLCIHQTNPLSKKVAYTEYVVIMEGRWFL